MLVKIPKMAPRIRTLALIKIKKAALLAASVNETSK